MPEIMNHGKARPKKDRTVLGKLGSLYSKIASAPDEVLLAQGLRHKVFRAGKTAGMGSPASLDADKWDTVCDHLLIMETKEDRLVATSRLLTSAKAKSGRCGFYTQSEFDVHRLMQRNGHLNFLELGRTCVLPDWRSRRSVELLWHSIWAYSLAHDIDVMIGCASFTGTSPEKLTDSLSYLFHRHMPPKQWQTPVTSKNSFSMDVKAADEINSKHVFRTLPPLIKGYLRLGAWVGPEAVIDHDFGTIDILIILPVENLNPRYVEHYGKDADRYAPVNREN